MSLQPWSWQILILIQLRWQYFQIFCLWRRSLCLNLVLTLKNCIEPPSYASNASTAYVVAIWPSFLFESLETNLGNWWDFFGQMVYPPPPAKNFPYAYASASWFAVRFFFGMNAVLLTSFSRYCIRLPNKVNASCSCLWNISSEWIIVDINR